MSTHQRYHSRKSWAWDWRNSRQAAGGPGRFRDPKYRRCDRRDSRWQRPLPREWVWRDPQRHFHGSPASPAFQRPPRQWPPHRWRDPRWERIFQWFPPGTHHWDWMSRVMPRRGPPVAELKVPHRYSPEDGKKRQPRGTQPRSTLCGGPARSADEPQTSLPKKTHGTRPTEGKRNVKTLKPAIITVEKNG